MLEAFRNAAVDRLSQDERVLGVLMTGSLAAGTGDRFSDLDLVVVVAPDNHASVMADRKAIAAGLGDLLTCFTGEHVGEPRLLICLYGVVVEDGVIHVDLKVITPDDLAARVDEPVFLYDPTGVCRAEAARTVARWPERDAQWFEDRIWVWFHYVAGRLARGERLEALAAIGFIREQVLAPMATTASGLPQRALRRFEVLVPTAVGVFEGTVGDASKEALWIALARTVELYRELRTTRPPESPALAAERAVTTYIEHLRTEFA